MTKESVDKCTGVINVYKEKGWTSHDVVGKLRRILGMKRIGHTGTLDPQVEGVLPICVGRATRIAEYIQDRGKCYRAIMRLGLSTTTQDMEGEMIRQSEYIPSRSELEDAIEGFRGVIQQIPPMYSAVHVNGVRLYELARRGIEVDRPAREVTIYSLEPLDYEYPLFQFDCCCSKGTYIRTLCHDLGEKLGSLGAMQELVRTSSGPYQLKGAKTLSEIESIVEGGGVDFLMPMDSALDHFDAIHCLDEDFKKITNGETIELPEATAPKLYRVYCKGLFIGVGEVPGNGNTSILRIRKMLL